MMKLKRLFFALLLVPAGCALPPSPHEREGIISDTLTSTVQIFVRRVKDPEGSPETGPEGGAKRAVNVRRAGSGVVVYSEGKSARSYILTAKHLVAPLVDQEISVMAPTRTTHMIARLVGVSDEYDLALLEIAGLDLTPVRLKWQATLGDSVWVVSFPWGRRRTVVTGVVSQIEWDEKVPSDVPISGPVLLIDAPVSYGTSGGGVFDQETGLLIGIVRGYRTAELSLPGAEPGMIRFPAAGETTVMPTSHIVKFMATVEPKHLLRVEERAGN